MSGGHITVRVEKPAHGGVVVAGLEIVPIRFGVVDVVFVTQRIDDAEVLAGDGGGNGDAAVSVIGIVRHRSAESSTPADRRITLHQSQNYPLIEFKRTIPLDCCFIKICK